RKGITPVIAMILLILIVVALGGVFAAWTTRSWEQLGETGEQQIEQVTEQLSISISIDSVFCDSAAGNSVAYLRNTGSSDITGSDITVYVDDGTGWDLINPTLVTDPLLPGAVSDVTGLGTLNSDDKVRITVGGNSATYTCD
ncbi:MAG: hypothetical protein JSV92_04350, partial [archaeon]